MNQQVECSFNWPQILPIKESTKSQKPVIPILDSIVYFPNKITQISPKLSIFFATVPFFQEISHKNPWPHPKSCALQLVQILRHGVQAGSAGGAIQALRGGSSWDGKTWKNLGFTNQITEKCHLKCSPKNQLKPPSCSSTSKKPVLGWRATTSCRSRSASCWAARWSGTRSLADASPLSSGTKAGRPAAKGVDRLKSHSPKLPRYHTGNTKIQLVIWLAASKAPQYYRILLRPLKYHQV